MKKLKEEKISPWLVAGVLMIVILAMSPIVIAGMQHNSLTNKYGNEAIAILEKYKDAKISAKEAGTKLNALKDEIHDDYEAAPESRQKDKLYSIWLDVIDIERDLTYKGDAPDYKIDETIEKIERHKQSF